MSISRLSQTLGISALTGKSGVVSYMIETYALQKTGFSEKPVFSQADPAIA